MAIQSGKLVSGRLAFLIRVYLSLDLSGVGDTFGQFFGLGWRCFAAGLGLS